MRVRVIAGVLILAFVLSGIVVAVVKSVGIKGAIIVWGLSIALTGLIALAFYLIAG